MEVIGICIICGRTKKLFTCALCGRLVCGQCLDVSTGICRQCSRGRGHGPQTEDVFH